MSERQLTQQQQKWFTSVRDVSARDTGRSMDEWVQIALTCPETAHRSRLRWFKDNHGLLQNRASIVLDEAFPSVIGWSEPESLITALWTDEASLSIFEAVNIKAMVLTGTIQTARKTFTAWSRKYQFAAVRPAKGGQAILGLAIPPQVSAELAAARNEGWSERLTARIVLSSTAEIDGRIEAWLHQAWTRS